MKIALFSVLAAVIAVFIIGGVMSEPDEGKDPAPAAPAEYSPEFERQAETPAGEETAADDSGAITVFLNGETAVMPMRDYLIGALASEMPADFEPEALKAQAVAARTYALYKGKTGSSAHPDAAVCGDYSCCAAYAEPGALAEKWGAEFYVNLNKIERAVDETAGLCLVWEDEPILAVFHASSGGATESCGALWGKQLPYLVSVSSPETENVTESVLISWDEFMSTVLAAYPEAIFGENRADWFSVTELSDSGRAARVNCGGAEMTGTEFRFLFGLRSTDIQAELREDGLMLAVSGYGHGVGMSQQGAEAMAEKGSDFCAILGHYYPGTEIVPLAISDILG